MNTPDTDTASAAPGEREWTPPPAERDHPFLTIDTLAKGVVTGVAVSVIVHSGRTLIGGALKNPAVLFGLGLASGYLAHKYRREIIAAADSAAGQGMDFVSRQGRHLKNILPAEEGADGGA